MSLNILLVDDHTLFREGLESLLSRRDINVLAEPDDPIEGTYFSGFPYGRKIHHFPVTVINIRLIPNRILFRHAWIGYTNYFLKLGKLFCENSILFFSVDG